MKYFIQKWLPGFFRLPSILLANSKCRKCCPIFGHGDASIHRGPVPEGNWAGLVSVWCLSDWSAEPGKKPSYCGKHRTNWWGWTCCPVWSSRPLILQTLNLPLLWLDPEAFRGCSNVMDRKSDIHYQNASSKEAVALLQAAGKLLWQAQAGGGGDCADWPEYLGMWGENTVRMV